jgi:hypothetical protein
MRRLLAIGVIWVGCAAAWAVLGGTLAWRSSESGGSLLGEVHALWGPPLRQLPPSAKGIERHHELRREAKFDEERKQTVVVEKDVEVASERPLPLESSDVAVRLGLEHRRKGLLWFPTYAVEFRGRYAFRNDGPEPRTLDVTFPLEQGAVVYDGFAVNGPEGAPVPLAFESGRVRFERSLAPGATYAFDVAYRARGTSRWGYGGEGTGLGPEPGRARRFRLDVETNFPNVDFPAGSLSPTSQERGAGVWRGTWSFDQIVGTSPVAIELPQRLNPGPLAARITFFAPVALLFFVFVNAMLLAARRRSIHPVNYFLLACGFFAFHLLFAYLIDHLEVGPSFAIASAVSVGLVVSYARLFVGTRTAVLQLGASQLVYLVLFSFTFFWQGFTGLAISVGAVGTLFLVMQLTGRLDWGRVLAGAPDAPRGAA